MPREFSPQKIQRAVAQGVARLANFRAARLMFLRNYTGQYYDRKSGEVGTEALNLIFNAIRVLIPNIVMTFPTHQVRSKYLAHKGYAELLSLALQAQDRDLNITRVYRQVIVDAIFSLGTLKTGLASSGSVYELDGTEAIDPGTIYTEVVDFDNLVVDPECKAHLFHDARFIGDRIRVPRMKLLESGLYNNHLIESLPPVGEQRSETRGDGLSKNNIQNSREDSLLEDQVDVIELWVPEANALVTVPGAKDVIFEEFLRVADYYGPDAGPYTFLALTPPVPANPLPVPAVGVWNDLHTMANRMAKKIADQAERQKDILTYRRAAADDAQAIVDAADGEAIALDDPDAIRVHSFGGQQQSNEVHLAQLQNWFNMMSANAEALAGQRSDAGSATEARILARNASVHLEDMRDLVYQMAAAEARKRAWYLHTDPLIELPLIRRVQQPTQYQVTPQGISIVSATTTEEQVMLTPEARRGDFLDFAFVVEPESMSRKDGQARYLEAVDFATKILPAVMASAQTAAMLGIPFSAKAFLLQMAKDRGIDWMESIFLDPEIQMQAAIQASMGPQAAGSKGQRTGSSSMLPAIMQNGQPGQVQLGGVSEGVQERQDQQAGAVEDQRMMKTGLYQGEP